MAVVSKGESFWRDLISQRKTLNLTIDEACEQAGVSRASFYHWQKRFAISEPCRASNNIYTDAGEDYG